MTYLRYAIALVLTIALLGLARRTSTRHTAEYSVRIADITAAHRTVTEAFGEKPILNVAVAPSEGLSAILYYSTTKGGPYAIDTMVQTNDGFTGTLSVLEKGATWYYHIDMLKDGSAVGRFPANGDQFIKFKGHVPVYAIVPHIFCMFATVFIGLMTVFTAYDVAKGKGDIRKSTRYLLWTNIFVFIGGFPLGYYVAYAAFGKGWSGIPVGWDITDNKTVILFLFWLVTLILARKGLKGEKIAISNGAYFTLTIVSFAVSIISFMIPHSI